MGSTRQRARSVQDKELRKVALLDAARELAAEQGVREVTLTAVTARVGLHPSALRRYFESREELLLELAQGGWADWRDGLLAELGAARDLEPERVAALVAETMVRLPLFCDLLTHVALSLEGAVRIERARQYKLAAGGAYDRMVVAVVTASADLDKVAAQLLLTGAMTIGAYLYQLSQPTETLRRLYEEQPRWAHTALHFREQLTTLLTTIALGARPGVRPDVGGPLPDVVAGG
ncbi:TetR family transcriptional regulator [Nocardia aurantia]|uniref:TetR family transcriptional regulator n=1 Tax=Nocardia aurantia TaxID=2585199 RepID=UPI0029E7EC5F|nr:TetR family transcriptional regulator [Nocardia aurantia]